MAKRGAGTELNHDNWDQEEESEEAGEFKKASEDQMKGRIIRKAKRRNLNEDQRKNVFSGFGGFTSSNIDAKEAFSFLSKPAEGNEPKSEGLFGSLSAAKKPPESSGFSFGVSSNDGGAEAGKTAFSGFSFGNTAKDKEEESKETNAGKDVDKVEEKINEELKGEKLDKESGPTLKPSAEAPPVDDLFAKFKSKSAGTWTCDVCMISNDSTKVKCAACETPKPGAKTETVKADTQPSFSFGAGGGFKFGAAAAPNTSAPELTPEAPPVETALASTDAQPTFSFGEGGGFKFGAASATTTSSSSLAGFKFGSGSVNNGVSNGCGSGFIFGSSEPSKPVGQSAGFKFGSSEVTSKPTFGTLEPGSSPSEAVSTGFKFGTASPSGTGAKHDIFKSAEGGFKFSANEKVASKVKVEACDTPQTKSKKSEYLADLKALNIQVTNWIKSHVDGNPLVDLTPVFKDYEKHLDEMRKKFNVQASIRPSDKVKLNLDNETTRNDKSEKVEAKIEENTVTSVENAGEEPKPFSFGLNQSGFGTGFGTSNSSFQFGFLKKDEKVEETKSDEDEAVSSEPVLETIVETDAFYTKKCKLFYKKAGAYVERGLGNIYLKKTEESKLQVIVRADTALGNILLNIIMTEDIPVDRVGKNNVMLICLPNPPVDPKADPEPVTFLIRVKTTEDADELKDKLGEFVKTEN